MNPRLYITAALLPLTAAAALFAPALTRLAPSSPPNAPPVVAPAPEAPPGPIHATASVDRDLVYAEGDRTLRVKVDLWADPGQGRTVPTDLIVVLDRSGSMSGDKILDARAAATELVAQLGPEDHFGLVSFGSDVRVDLPTSERGPAWQAAIDRLSAGGGTAMAQGLVAGLDLVRPLPGRARRVVLISDGMPDSAQGLDGLAGRAASLETPLTTIGIGADYDEDLMERLADRGTGNFYWATRGPELQRVLASELSTARETVASGLALELHGGAHLVDAGGLPVSGDRAALGTMFAGQHRTLWLTVQVPPGTAQSLDLGELVVAWQGADGALQSRIDLPAVALTHDPAVAYAKLGDDWADSQINDEYNRVRTEVSAAVQSGDAQRAQRVLSQYKEQTTLMNGYAANSAVVDNLAEVEALEREVAITSQAERAQQNLWAKGTRVDAYNKRRVGQTKNP